MVIYRILGRIFFKENCDKRSKNTKNIAAKILSEEY